MESSGQAADRISCRAGSRIVSLQSTARKRHPVTLDARSSKSPSMGGAIIAGGMVSEFMGSGLGLTSSLPGGLWEVFMGVWLIVKGFKVGY